MYQSADRVPMRCLALAALICTLLLVSACVYTEPVPPYVYRPVGLIVLGHSFAFAPGSDGTLQLQVRDLQAGQAQANARVKVYLATPGRGSQQVFAGATDANGMVTVRFAVPETVENPDQQLTIVAETDKGSAQYAEDVYVGRIYNVLLSTDKPVYQPGQVIHMRTLALDTVALKAARAQPLVLGLRDPQGNRIMRRELTTSDWGLAAADFTLDSQAPSGDYVITAEMGPVTSSRTVEVKPYTLPRFKINFASDRNYYLPGERVTGTIDAQYFFGKPVAGGEVRITGLATDVERHEIFQITGEAGPDGAYRYEFPVPDTLVAQAEKDTAAIDLEITVVDKANHAESVTESVTVARQVLLVDAVPESGFLRPGVENIVYLQVTYPDGAGAQAELAVQAGDSQPQTVQTDEYGLATIALTPATHQDVVLKVRATDDQGQAAEHTLTLGTTGGTTAVLLRPERAAYRIGETLNVDAYVSGRASTVYLDVVKEGQTFGLAALPVENGAARASLDIDGSLLGTVELHAYVITDQGEIVRDRRLVLVNPAPVQVDVQADAEVYRPGDIASLALTVSRDGAAMPAALGISIVDESVFSVGAQDPGFARTYFLLERELLEPRYEIHDFTPFGGGERSPYDREYEGVHKTAYAPGLERARRVALLGALAEELALDDVNAGQRALHEARLMPPSAPVKADTGAARRARASGQVATLWMLLPLAGLTLSGGRKPTRGLLTGLVLLGLVGLIAISCGAPAVPAPAPAPAAMEAPAAEPADAEVLYEGEAPSASPGPPRLRQFFPETLYWLPELTTDAAGRAEIQVPIADSITTWRVSILASDQDGNLGSSETSLRVFQDFFVEPDLPRFLTQGDEIEVPVSIYNYLDEPQEIHLEVEPAPWFEFIGGPARSYQVGANEVAAAYIPIRVTGFGLGDLKITATGSRMSDAVLRQVEVWPDGKRADAVVASGRLRPQQTVEVALPETAIPGAARVTVKVFPGIVSQAVQGLEGLLRQPYGCFEQTSSTTYPNVLVLDYLKSTGQIAPRTQLQAEEYINLGYQRLLTFEVAGTPGGFSLFGEPPAQTMLTAYGLMEFTDMARVSYVDPALPERTATFLFGRQAADGSWAADGMTIESGWERLGDARVPVTAYIAWALAEAGYGQGEPVQRALRYVRGAATADMDPYALAIVVNALLAADPADSRGLELLRSVLSRAESGEDDTLYWRSDLPTYMGGSGEVASVETTAMVAMALIRSGLDPTAAQEALDFLISQRDSFGAFQTTQATILSLKALMAAAKVGGEGGEATVEIALPDGRRETLSVNAENFDTVQQVSFDDLRPGMVYPVSLTVGGSRALQYQVTTEYYVPWSAVTEAPVGQPAMRVDVVYDRTELEVNDTVGVAAEVELLAGGQAGMVLVDLGIPPGFSPLSEDLDALVEGGAIGRYELTGRQVLLYLTDVTSGQIYRFAYRLRARFPLRAQTPSSQAYDYYAPDRRDTRPPQRITVKLGTPQP